ncbi:BgTH12-02558 [Blumeria graminis f. sp. triticale]|uniref:Bgt-55065 n=2 Tax=Blumeria graminis TaxID=34373 RepID=A0A9X9MHU0_BLUGR|nr:BgTH12-02558 [Blumeria graminis f. sp. triticale]VDB88680.1 Bgt-55065 [Blumeria graminis f. sp. tritici]
MKFFNAPLTAALTGLLLLVPTAHGLFEFKCNSGEIVSENLVRSNGGAASFYECREGDPAPPAGEWFGVK